MENYAYNLTSSYPESGNSSPHSREIEFENHPPWEDSSQQLPPNLKVKFMCSYGGKIHPRPHDNLLSYIGGETKILAVDRSIKFANLLSKLISLCDDDSISFKYQLPGEDLDSLISVTCDDDLEHMMQEYDRLYRISPKPARLRLFLFPNQNPSRNSSLRSFGSEEGIRSEKERFVEALNSAPVMTAPLQPPQPVTSNVDFLFGREKGTAMVDPVPLPGLDERLIGSDPIQKHILDLQRLRLEEQQHQQQAANYWRKSEGNLNAGEYYRVPPEKVAVSGGVPYWTEKQVPGGGVNYPANPDQQQVYMVPAPASAYHAPQMVTQVSGVPPNQGYYAVQRMPSPEMYRDQQQQMYNMITSSAMQSMPAVPPPSVPPRKMVGFSDGYGMVRDPAYGQVAYDSGMGRQVIYSAQGGVMGAPPPQYQAAMATAVSADMRPGGGPLITETGGKVVAGRATQASV